MYERPLEGVDIYMLIEENRLQSKRISVAHQRQQAKTEDSVVSLTPSLKDTDTGVDPLLTAQPNEQPEPLSKQSCKVIQ